jgi:predicted ATPase/DNA-binding winged helix-turn-helix (wHTH) protein
MTASTEPAPNRMVSFGPFRLYPARQILLEGDRPLRLGSRALEILNLLVESRGELVGKSELVARVWPNVFVDDTTLRVHIAALRKVLGDGQAGARYIVNVTGRGYRFVAPIADDLGPTVAAPAIAVGHNLPPSVTRMIGRAQIVGGLAERLVQKRFLTIVGPGGMGKTTVALAVAEQLVAGYRDHACFLGLASLTDPLLVPSALASALSLSVPAEHPIPALVAGLRNRQMLLVLDNCEHLIAAVAELAEEIFRGAPGVHILATSREPLNAEGEWVHRLPALGLPPGGAAMTTAEALAFPAIELFVERTMASLDSFVLLDADLLVIGDICRRLDGIPLAIELAAARVDLFGVRGLAARLDDRFAILTKGRRTALPRHQTLRATLDWSYRILPSQEQRILWRLSVFKGGFALDQAMALCPCAKISSVDVLDGVTNLVAKSLVTAEIDGEAVRYRLLDMTRAYAAEKLRESDEGPVIARRYALHCCSLLERAEADWEAQPLDRWLASYAWRIDDVRNALDWAFSPAGDISVGLTLAAVSAPLWFALSLVDEYRTHLERALEHIGAAEPDPEREMRLNITLASAIFNTKGPVPGMAAASARALTIADRLGAQTYQLQALWGLSRGRYAQGDYPAALDFTRKFGVVAEASGDPGAVLIYDRMISLALHLVGEHAQARHHAERALTHPAGTVRTAHKGLYEYDHQVAVRSHYARILWIQGLPDQALAAAEEGVQRALSLDFAPPLCAMLSNSACPVAFWTGDVGTIRRYLAILAKHSTTLLSDYWRAFGRSYEAVLALGPDDGTGALDQRAAALRQAALGPLHIDILGTLHERLAGPEAMLRAESGLGDWCAPEILRARGTTLLAGGQADAAEDLFRRSLGLARRQGALAWELRTATSLAALWRDRGRRGPALDLLGPAHDRFREGTTTADLVGAAALLTELGA